MTDTGTASQQRVLELRVFLTGFCARLAARRITPTQIERMEALLRRLDAGHGGDKGALQDIDRAFQRLLHEAADNTYLTFRLESLCHLSPHNWPLVSNPIERDRATIERLGRLLEALKDGDELAAETIVREHIVQSQKGTSQTL
jgi:DNA-binding FadR family transcriptional regulator